MWRCGWGGLLGEKGAWETGGYYLFLSSNDGQAFPAVEPGKWLKGYKDGFLNGKKLSVQYFKGEGGKLPGVKI